MESLKDYADQNEIQKGMELLYPNFEKISIDYALMEKADNIVMACGSFAWDDVGTWTSLENHFKADESGNTIIGDISTLDSKSNIIYSKIVTQPLGCWDLIVVQADGVTLVCAKEEAQRIKSLVNQMSEQDPESPLI